MDAGHGGQCDICGVVHGEDEDHRFNYVDREEINPNFIDPITQEPLFDAVILSCPGEHVFSLRTLRIWLQTKPQCPLCKCSLQSNVLKAAFKPFANLLDDLLVRPEPVSFAI